MKTHFWIPSWLILDGIIFNQRVLQDDNGSLVWFGLVGFYGMSTTWVILCRILLLVKKCLMLTKFGNNFIYNG